MKPFRVAVMYGSQTGNAQAIAERIHDGFKQKEVDSGLFKCDAWKKMTPELKEWNALVLVVSTTGNGDAPENAERFWRFIKRRTNPKDMLAGFPFAVLGLGDTNYDKFCFMGKSFDKRLRELGAVTFQQPAFADEATNMEETIEPWITCLFSSVDALRVGNVGADEQATTEGPPLVSETSVLEGQSTAGNDTAGSALPRSKASAEQKPASARGTEKGPASNQALAVESQEKGEGAARVDTPTLRGGDNGHASGGAAKAVGAQKNEVGLVVEQQKGAPLAQHRIAIMYGSQTGNAQSIAEGVHHSCKEGGLESTLLACDGWKKRNPELKDWTAAVFVVSTTGNGDAPENAERFWRYLKRRSHGKDLLSGLPFALLGLGDTNYDKFCYMGKSIDKRLRELGATPFHAPAFADEATNMEETVEPWLRTLLPALKALISLAGEAAEEEVESSSPQTPTEMAGVQASSNGIAGNGNAVASEVPDPGLESLSLTPPKASVAEPLERASPNVSERPELVASTVTAATEKAADKSSPANGHGDSGTGDHEATVAAIKAVAAEAFGPELLATPNVSRAAIDSQEEAFTLLSVSKSSAAEAPRESPADAAGSRSRGEAGAGVQQPVDAGTVVEAVGEETATNGMVAAVETAPWSPSRESGVLPLSRFLSAEHLAPGYSPSKDGLPRTRPAAADLVFPTLAAGDGSAADGLRPRIARQRSSSMESRHTLDWPFRARVLGARYLTEGGREADRRVILMELSLKGSGIAYEPGDAIGIRCPNPAKATAYLLERLQESLPPGAGPDVPFEHSLRTLPSPCTLRVALTTKLDLQSPLRRPMIRALAKFCSDDKERSLMELLCAKSVSGSAVYAQYVAAQSLTLCELLEAFPSCKPHLGTLLAILPPLPPRYYSVASSQLVTPGSLAVAFTVVSHSLPVSSCGVSDASAAVGERSADANAERNSALPGGKLFFVSRRGVCTNWLEELLEPFLQGDGRGRKSSREGTVPIFVKPTKEFLLPGSAKWPCVLIGPGTGVSPFVGFLKHREAQLARQRQTIDAVCSGFWRGGYEISLEGEEDETAAYRGREGRGDMSLFFGCRNEAQDWIFRDEMKAFVAKGTLARLSTAFSRDSAEKVYVQDRILESGQELSHLMLNEGAYVYVCGDGKAMAQGVHRALVQVLTKHGAVGDEAGAEAALRDMKERHRYVLDVWS